MCNNTHPHLRGQEKVTRLSPSCAKNSKGHDTFFFAMEVMIPYGCVSMLNFERSTILKRVLVHVIVWANFLMAR